MHEADLVRRPGVYSRRLKEETCGCAVRDDCDEYGRDCDASLTRSSSREDARIGQKSNDFSESGWQRPCSLVSDNRSATSSFAAHFSWEGLSCG